MSVIDELQDSLGETRRDVEKVLDDLNSYSGIKDSLQIANTSIKDSADGLNSLAASLGVGVDSLGQLTQKLGQVTDLVRETDPGLLLAAQQATEKKIDSLNLAVVEIQNAFGKVLDSQAATQDKIGSAQALLEKRLDSSSKQLERLSEIQAGMQSSQTKLATLVEKVEGKTSLNTAGAILILLMVGAIILNLQLT